jgi:hypothetical protein
MSSQIFIKIVCKIVFFGYNVSRPMNKSFDVYTWRTVSVFASKVDPQTTCHAENASNRERNFSSHQELCSLENEGSSEAGNEHDERHGGDGGGRQLHRHLQNKTFTFPDYDFYHFVLFLLEFKRLS